MQFWFPDRKTTIPFSFLPRQRVKCYRCESDMHDYKRSVTWNYVLTAQFMNVNIDNYISLSYDSFIFCKFPSPPCLMFTIKIYQIFESLQYIRFPNLYDNICNFTSKRYTWWCMNRPIYALSFNNITVSWCVSKKFTKPKVCCQSPGSFVSCTRPHLLWLWCRNLFFFFKT